MIHNKHYPSHPKQLVPGDAASPCGGKSSQTQNRGGPTAWSHSAWHPLANATRTAFEIEQINEITATDRATSTRVHDGNSHRAAVHAVIHNYRNDGIERSVKCHRPTVNLFAISVGGGGGGGVAQECRVAHQRRRYVRDSDAKGWWWW